MIVLVDGDVVAYRCSWSANEEDEEQAIEKVDGLMDDIRFATTSREEDMEVYLTGSGNFRYEVNPSYKANRSELNKPVHLQAVRQHIIDNWGAVVSEGQEADDLIAIRASNLGYDCIIASIDKDFQQIPCRHYNTSRGEWSFVDEFQAHVFFYTQMLTGDRADNVEGIYGVGPKKAAKVLEGCTTEEELYAAVLDRYNNDEERVINTARLLWLRRKEGEMWLPPSQR